MVDSENIKDFEIKFQIQGKDENINDVIIWFNNRMGEHMKSISSMSIREVER